MGNRKQPFGYRVEFGSVVIEPREATVVIEVYENYARGSSYTTLTQMLNEQPVSYDEGKRWNKNMVARILQDDRYIGERGFPTIIEKNLASSVSFKREHKIAPNASKTEIQNAIRKLGVHKVTKELEDRVLGILAYLWNNPNVIVPQHCAQRNELRLRALEIKLSEMLKQESLDENAIKKCADEIATVRYESINDSEYETEYIKYRLSAPDKQKIELASLLLDIARKISISRKGNIQMFLRNGQIIE